MGLGVRRLRRSQASEKSHQRQDVDRYGRRACDEYRGRWLFQRSQEDAGGLEIDYWSRTNPIRRLGCTGVSISCLIASKIVLIWTSCLSYLPSSSSSLRARAL